MSTHNRRKRLAWPRRPGERLLFSEQDLTQPASNIHGTLTGTLRLWVERAGDPLTLGHTVQSADDYREEADDGTTG